MSNMDNLKLLVPSQGVDTSIFRWCVVTGTSPLRIRIDEEDTELPITPGTLVAGLAVGDRVWVQFISNPNPTSKSRRAIIHGKSDGLRRMGCTLRRNSFVSIPNGGSATTISWQVEDFDSDGMWSSGSTITIPAPAVWSLNLQTEWASALGTGRAFMSLEDSTGAIYRLPLYGSGETFFAMSWTMPMAAGVTFSAKVFQTSGAAVNLNVARLHAYRVSV